MEIALQRASFRVPVSDAEGGQPRVGPQTQDREGALGVGVPQTLGGLVTHPY